MEKVYCFGKINGWRGEFLCLRFSKFFDLSRNMNILVAGIYKLVKVWKEVGEGGVDVSIIIM
jgi:hypothetical protein